MKWDPATPYSVIGYTAIGTAAIFWFVKVVLRGLRESDEVLSLGDIAIHEEEAFPEPIFGEPLLTPSHLHPDNV